MCVCWITMFHQPIQILSTVIPSWDEISPIKHVDHSRYWGSATCHHSMTPQNSQLRIRGCTRYYASISRYVKPRNLTNRYIPNMWFFTCICFQMCRFRYPWVSSGIYVKFWVYIINITHIKQQVSSSSTSLHMWPPRNSCSGNKQSLHVSSQNKSRMNPQLSKMHLNSFKELHNTPNIKHATKTICNKQLSAKSSCKIIHDPFSPEDSGSTWFGGTKNLIRFIRQFRVGIPENLHPCLEAEV